MESLGIHHRMLSDPTSYVIRDDDIYLINDGKFVSTLDDNMAKSDMTSLFEFLYSRMQFLRDMECNVSKLCFECGTVNQVRKLPFLLTLQEQYKYTRQIFKFVKIHMSSDERKKFFTELFNYKKYLGNWRRKCRKFDVLYEVLNFSTHDYDADSPASLFTFIEKVLNHIEERAEALKPDLKKVHFSFFSLNAVKLSPHHFAIGCQNSLDKQS